MSFVKPKTLKGFRDLLPQISNIKQELTSKLIPVFKSYGFLPIETPILEYLESLVGETEGEISKQLISFTDKGKRDVCMRFDLTVPLARYFCQHKNDIGVPFKRYAIGECFRGENPQRGRYRQFTQCDFDIIGSDSITSDVETISIVSNLLKAIDISDYTIFLNNRRLMNNIFIKLGFEEKMFSEILIIVDKFKKIGIESCKEILISEKGLDSEKVSELFEIINPDKFSNNLDLIKFLEKDFLEDSVFFSDLLSKLKLLNIDTNKIKIDLTIVRGLGYYTGLVFETFLNSDMALGSVSSGGRYDNLTQNFSNESLPSVGGSFGLDRFIAHFENKVLDSNVILLAQLDLEAVDENLKLLNTLRDAGLLVDYFPNCSKFKKQISYAEKKGLKYIIIQGNREIANNSITLKNISDGSQLSFESATDLINYFISS